MFAQKPTLQNSFLILHVGRFFWRFCSAPAFLEIIVIILKGILTTGAFFFDSVAVLLS